jgi:hypothetical protein
MTPIGLQEWIMMIPMIMIPTTLEMKMKDKTRKKTKKTKSRINSNKLTLKRSKPSSEMPRQEINSKVHVPNDNANEEQLEH